MMYCSDCRLETNVVFDHSSGDAVCSDCGLVLESHYIDETSEWRTFAEDDGVDKNRVGAATNPLLSGGGLSTVMAKPNGEVLRDHHIRDKDPDQSLLMAFRTIETMCDRLCLVTTIKARANQMYKKLEDQKCSKGRNQDAVCAALLYIACKQEDKPRTLKEIFTVANGASKREIGRAKEYISKELGFVEEPGQEAHAGAGDYMRRFCSALGLNNQAIRAAQEAMQKLQEFDIRRSPVSIAAAVIFLITQLSDDSNKKPLKDIAYATGVAPATIKSTYKDLSPYESEIIPNWYHIYLSG